MPFFKKISGTKTKIFEVDSVQLSFGGLELNQSVTVIVDYYDINMKFLFGERVVISGEDYNNWTDDIELMELIISRLEIQNNNQASNE